MKEILQTVDQLNKTLQSLIPFKTENQQRLDKKIRLEFNFNSNHIEGNTLTYGETELLLIFDKTTGNHEWREYEEMKAHDVAFSLIKEWATNTERPLTEMAIKNLHEVLLVRPFWKDAETSEGRSTRRLIKVGDYKEFSNSVRLQNGEMFHYASPEETPILMGELIQWYRNEEGKAELHPVALAASLHYKFVRIHPFDDGNGRISRLLMNYVLLKHNLPPIIIKSSDKKKYLFALNQADAGDLDAFINYIAEQEIWSINISINAAKGEEIDEPEDLDKKIFLLKKQLGENTNIKVELKYSQKAIEKVIINSLIPLTEIWEQKLEAFEPLFLSKEVRFIIEHHGLAGNSFDESFKTKLKNYLKNDLVKLMKNKQLFIRSSFKGLRNINNTVSMNGGQITVHFFENAYEINWVSQNVLNKLYHQDLNKKELETIVFDLGNRFHNNIIEFIENNKTSNAE